MKIVLTLGTVDQKKFIEFKDFTIFKSTLVLKKQKTQHCYRFSYFTSKVSQFFLKKYPLLPRVSQKSMFYLFLPFHFYLVIILFKSFGNAISFKL